MDPTKQKRRWFRFVGCVVFGHAFYQPPPGLIADWICTRCLGFGWYSKIETEAHRRALDEGNSGQWVVPEIGDQTSTWSVEDARCPGDKEEAGYAEVEWIREDPKAIGTGPVEVIEGELL